MQIEVVFASLCAQDRAQSFSRPECSITKATPGSTMARGLLDIVTCFVAKAWQGKSNDTSIQV
jgi:hypothetical protein